MPNLQQLIAELTSGDQKRAENAVQEIVNYGEAAIPELNELLSVPQSDTRWWGIRALAEIMSPQVMPLLRNALHDPDTSVRQCAALALGKQRDPGAVPDLITALSDDDRLLARLAADALSAVGETAVPALLEVMKTGQQNIRLEAVRVLATIGDQRAIPALFEALDEDSALMEYWAEVGLERIGVGMMFFKPT